ncbi:MAG: amino acid dehydrogenase [Legionellales bacterium RIFCSPHIGHO2_12_FULL_37_14]|nr:MAG: amino acid dehydrogenase [Legionellales bacterium RIFCSPHIGHO2_12_FULL_37_14]
MSTTKEQDLANLDFLKYGLEHKFGELHFIMDSATGLKGFVAIHNTKLGPALGGLRLARYPNEKSAILDGMRLARGMSYKAALANLPLGGGKGVIIEPETEFDRQGYMDVIGKFIEQLNGRYITAVDLGTNLEDMDRIYTHTKYVSSLSSHHGDPSPYTAKGVLHGIEALVDYVLKKPSLKGVHIAIQGLGHVGSHLAEYLNACGARLTVSDIDEDKTHAAKIALGAAIVPSAEIHATDCDVFAPCARGGIINDSTINEIKAPIIAGAANNQLAHAYHGERLMEKGITYAVDYVINTGGLLFAASRYLKTEETIVHLQIENIGQTLISIVEQARKSHTPTNIVADRIAEEKLK